MSNFFKRLVILGLSALLLFSGAGGLTATARGLAAFADVPASHWAHASLERWHDHGLLAGFGDKTMRPDNALTRAEFAAWMNRLFGLTATTDGSWSDVSDTAWYAADMNKAVAAGYLGPDEAGRLHPDRAISRADTVVALQGLFAIGLDVQEAGDPFGDLQGWRDEVREAVAALHRAGFVSGYTDGTFRPGNPLTRAEFASLADRLTSVLIDWEGEHEPGDVPGNLIVNVPGAVIKNTEVRGNLILAEGIGEGDVTLEHVVVRGETVVNGGGTNSVRVADSALGHVTVDKQGSVRIVLAGDSRVAKVTWRSGGKLEVRELSADAAGIAEVDIPADAADVALLGDFESVNLTAGNGSEGPVQVTIDGRVAELNVAAKATVQLSDEAVVETLNVAAGADETTIDGGEVQQINNEATDVTRDGQTVSIGSAAPGQSGGSSGSGSSPGPTKPAMWTLVWQDEFDGDALDLDKWRFQTGTGTEYGLTDWGNNEAQYYRAENTRVEDGRLIIEPKMEHYGGKAYTSSRLFTRDTYAKKYGKIEARIKLPEGTGFWPAFWMMPRDDVYGGWAASGEIDIMEAVGHELHQVHGTIHYGGAWPNNKYTGGTYHFPDGEDITDFHVYALEWEPGELRWYVDGHLYSTKTNWDATGVGEPAKYAFPAPFDQEFYLLLNMAIGGHYTGNVLPAESDFPATMEVDYVRVYELTGRPYKTVDQDPVIEREPLPDNAKLPIDGNYVHDPAFTQGFASITTEPSPRTTYDITDPERWNLVALDTFGGEAAATVEAVHGSQFARIDLSSGGSQTYAVQLIHNVTLGAGRYYKLSFDAKAAANRNMAIKVGGGPERGFAGYHAGDITLTPDVQTYEMLFQMEQETDHLARLEFNLGLNTSSVWIGNVVLEEIEPTDPFREEEPKAPLADGNHVYNGRFDLGRIDRMTYWQFATDGAEASARVDADKRELAVTIQDGGAHAEAITLVQPGLRLMKNNDYELTFRARGAANRPLVVALVSKDGQDVYTEQHMDLTADMSEHEVAFRMRGNTTDEARLVFRMGGHGADLVIDDVALHNVTDTEWVATGEQLLENGTFTSDLTGWDIYNHAGYGHADFRVEDGLMKADVSATGSDWWHIQFYQDEYEVPAGTYLVSVDLKADQARPVYLELTGQNGTANVPMMTFQADGTLRSHEQIITVPAGDYRFTLGFGRAGEDPVPAAPHTVYFDNVTFREVSPNLLDDGFFSKTDRFGESEDAPEVWKVHNQGWYETGAGQADFSLADGKVEIDVSSIGWDWWHIQLYQLGIYLEEGTYQLAFDLTSDTDRPVFVELAGGSVPRLDFAAKAHVPETHTAWVNVDTAGTYKFMFGFGKDGAHAEPAGPHKLTVDNVQLARVNNPPPTEPPGPAVFADATNNRVGQDIVLTFSDDPVWRQAIKAIRLAGDDVSGQTNIAEGSITLDRALFPVAATYAIEIDATDYRPVTVTQIVYAGDGNLVLGGDMTFDSGDWVKWEGDGGAAEVIYADGKVKLDIMAIGPNNWSIQFYQDGIPATAGNHYELSFKAASTVDRPIDIEHATGQAVGTFTLTNTEQVYSAVFTASNDALKLNFLIGNVDGTPAGPHAITLDEVRIVEMP